MADTPDRRLTDADLRAMPLADFAKIAAEINDSDALMKVYAAPEWSELHDDGKLWVQALVRETMARVAGAQGNEK